MRKFIEDYSLIRVLHAIPGADSVDVYINDSMFFNDLEFTEFSPYVYVPKGNYEITVYVTDTKENPILTQKIEVEEDELITIAIVSSSTGPSLLEVEEAKEGSTENLSKLRMVNLIPNSPEVDVLLDNKAIFAEVEAEGITEYADVAPATYRLDVQTSEGERSIASNRITINPDRIYTLYALGEVPNVDIYQSLDGATFIAPDSRHR